MQMMAATDKIKVLVLGDSGVGKSSLVHLVAYSQPIVNSSWTIGATIEVKQHEYCEGTPKQRSCFIELWDIGGSRAHSSARPIYYNSFHGIILVHDLTNSKSHNNLRQWLGEVFYSRDPTKESGFKVGSLLGAPAYETLDFDMESFAEKNIPVLVVATKLDVASAPSVNRSRLSSVADECSADEILLDCNNIKSFAPASTNAVKLSRFFDKVIERKYNAFKPLPSFIDRTRKIVTADNFTTSRYSHLH